MKTRTLTILLALLPALCSAQMAEYSLWGSTASYQTSDMAVAAPLTALNSETVATILSPYGVWMEVEPYGRVWRPYEAVQDADWRPYCHRGRWTWTARGWSWNSYYSWGHVPFHYGRWVMANPTGWVWVPGYEWAPAWVVWRHSPSYCGWAPLPPNAYYETGIGFSYRGSHVSFDINLNLGPDHYVFVPSHDFLSPYPCLYVAPRNRTTVIYTDTAVIYSDYRTAGVTIYSGLPPEAVVARSVPAPQPAVRDGGRLSRVIGAAPSAGGRVERVLAPAGSGAAARTPAPSGSGSASAGSRIGRIINSVRTSHSAPAGRTVGVKQASPIPQQRSAPAVQPKAQPQSSGGSRVSRIRDMYSSQGNR